MMVVTQSLVAVTCCTCGTPFGMEATLHESLLKDHGRWFYCPNGHQQHFTGPTPEQRLQRQLANMEESRNLARADANYQRDRAESLGRSLSATRGHLTRERRRVGNGVCPCCRRSFENLQRHMHAKHPDYAGQEA